MKAAVYQLEQAASLDDAVLRLQGEDFTKPVAGGQSLGAMMNLRLAQPDRLVDLDAVPGLAEAGETGDELLLGAMVTHAAIEDGLGGTATRGFLPYVAHGIAYRAVRNRGTVGGSLCHADPAADWVTAMAAAGAVLELHGPEGARSVAAAAFMQSAFECDLAPGEILRRIRVPRFSASARWSYRKFCRKTGEFALAIAAAVRDPARGVQRLVLGGLDGPPRVIEDADAIDRLFDAGGRAALLAQTLPGLAIDRIALHADLLAHVAADMACARGQQGFAPGGDA